ncbi:MAG TPA: hypothetical protein DCS30_00340, partial [Rhizobiales bacterium]|nr:hypothetical protein [Hyphomicrobiales bacterium]
MFLSLISKPKLSGLKRLGLVCLSLAFSTPSYAATTPSAIDWSVAPWQSVQSVENAPVRMQVAQAKTVENLRPKEEGAERDPDRDRDPDRGKGCSPFKPEFECDEETGEVIVTLVNSVGDFDADDISIKVLTPGITLSWPDPTDPLRVRLEGALPGQVIVLETSAVQVGGGSEPGLDKCCMGKIRIKVPRLPCNEDKPKLKVKKNCRKADDSEGGANAICDISVFYSGPAPTAANPLRLNDVMSGGGNWQILNVQVPHVWSCDAIPHNGPAPFGCELKSENQLAPIDWSNFSTFLRLHMKVDKEFENCATISTQSRGGKVEAKDCDKLGGERPRLTLEKTGPASCVAGADCNFNITIRNVGAGDFDASTLMIDQMNLNEARILDMNPMPAGCSAEMLGASGFACIRNLELGAGESQSFVVTTRVPVNSNARELRNCVGLYRDGNGFEAGGYSVDPDAGVDLPGDVLTILGDDDRLGYDCAEVPLTQVIAPEPQQPEEPQDPQTPPAPQGRPDLGFEKTSLGDCLVNERNRSYSCEFQLTTTNEGNVVYEGPLVISEQLGRPRALNLDVVGGDGWSCRLAGGSSATCIQPYAELAPGASASVTV